LAGGDYDEFALWIDPAAGDAGTPDALSSFAGSIDRVDPLGIRAANLDAGDLFLFDALTYGTTGSDGVPAPEPDTGLGVSLGLVALAWRRRGSRLRPKR
jgi:hypothetical protein